MARRHPAGWPPLDAARGPRRLINRDTDAPGGHRCPKRSNGRSSPSMGSPGDSHPSSWVILNKHVPAVMGSRRPHHVDNLPQPRRRGDLRVLRALGTAGDFRVHRRAPGARARPGGTHAARTSSPRTATSFSSRSPPLASTRSPYGRFHYWRTGYPSPRSVSVGNRAGTDRTISPGSKAQNPFGRHAGHPRTHQFQLGTPLAPGWVQSQFV